MLRNVSSRAAVRRGRLLVAQRRIPETAASSKSQAPTSFRSFATSEKKRALNSQQLKGIKTEPKTSGIPPPEAPVASESEKGSSLGPILALLLATGGAGAAYYNGLLDGQLGDKYKSKSSTVVAKEPDPPTKIASKEPEAVPKKEAVAKTKTSSSKKADESLAKVAREEVALSKTEIEEFNEIIADVISEATMEVDGVQEAVAAIAEEEKKNAAVAEKAAKMAKKAAKMAAAKKKKEEAAPIVEEQPPIVIGSATIATSTLDESKIMAEIQELKSQLNQKSDIALNEAHRELAKLGSLDIMGLDLDKMTPSQLKVRLVQMARDLEERTKWEAVRLQEFLSMKEKEVEDRYVRFEN